ncbi:MAG TPA: glycosyltransferase [Candidatus Competibacteraceae bacterium]|mgnify:CR=1 FL=1|nr:glycosyltransferase [Candidatus Competibacteraceae bacterium]
MQLIVLGMHRSGTSAVARLLNLMGAYFAPAELTMPANENNEKGYWERWDAFGLHEDMLRDLGLAWDRLSRFDARRLADPAFIAKFQPQAEKILLDLDARRPWLLKDPRLNLLLPFWSPLLEAPVVLYVHRNAIQVAQSLHRREDFPLPLSLALWEQYSVLGLAHSQAMPRLLISYHELMAHPVETAHRLYTQLQDFQVQGLRLPSEREIEAFIAPHLYHQQGDDSLLRGYANVQQLQLEQAFNDGSILTLKPLPALSAGAAAILRLHEDQQATLASIGHIKHRLGQVRRVLRARRTASVKQQAQIETYQNRWHQAEGQVVALEQRLEERQETLERLQRWLITLSGNIDAVFKSLTWRAGHLLTQLALALMLRKPDPGAHGQIVQILQDIETWRQTHPDLENGPARTGAATALARPERYAHLPVLTLPSSRTYKTWYAQHRCPPGELGQQRQEVAEWPDLPLISLTIPCYNSPPRWLDALLASIRQQSYPAWECILVDDASPRTGHLAVIQRWCDKDSRFRLIQHERNQGVGGASQTGLEAAQGGYFAVVDHDDLLEPNALYEVAQAIRQRHPDVVYSDEVLIRNNGRIIRCEFRPQFSYHFLLSHPYIVHLTVFRRELVLQAGGFDPNFQVSQDYDLLLRVAAVTHDFHHIPKVLYQWRIHPGSTGHQQMAKVTENSLAALNRHLRLSGLAEDEAQAVEGLSFNFFRVRYRIDPVTVSVIIPTRDRVDLLTMCVESLLGKTRLPEGVRLELIIVNNGSSQSDTLAYFTELEQQGHKILDAPGAFNFSRLNNLAAAQAKGEFLLFLNNDIEIVEPDWLEAMLELMAWDDVSVVGAKLLYPEIGLIQHAGVIIGFNSTAAHDHQFYPEHEHGHLAPGHHHAMLSVRECLAVTAACMLVRRKAFANVGGFDADLQVGFGDTDLCLRLRQAGYRCLFTPYARLIHHESATRGYDAVDTHPMDTKRFKERWVEQLTAGDPYYNPNLSLSGKLFQPRFVD